MKHFLLLLASSVFLTAAGYGHLRHRETSLWIAILVSWAIAFFEYCLQVPANRIGYASGFSAAQLKTIQEVVTLGVFAVFSATYFGNAITWNQIVGFVLIALGALFVFKPWA